MEYSLQCKSQKQTMGSVDFPRPSPRLLPARCCFELWERIEKMASGDRSFSVEQKKNELLRRIAEKKKAKTSETSTVSLSGSSSPNNPAPPGTKTLFTNDGNFLARFQQMQSSTVTSTTARPTVSMKLTTVKKTTEVKSLPKRLDVFENPLDQEGDNGNSFYTLLWYLFDTVRSNFPSNRGCCYTRNP